MPLAGSFDTHHYGGIAGGIIIGYFSSRLPFRSVATITLLVMGLAIAAFGGATHNLMFAKVSAVAIGFCIFGAAVLLYATAAATFPARVRATGIGLSMGAGRGGLIPRTIDGRSHAGRNSGPGPPDDLRAAGHSGDPVCRRAAEGAAQAAARRVTAQTPAGRTMAILPC